MEFTIRIDFCISFFTSETDDLENLMMVFPGKGQNYKFHNVENQKEHRKT